MKPFSISLPDSLCLELDKHSKKTKMSKNKIMEKALSLYLEELKRAAFIISFKRAKEDKEIMDLSDLFSLDLD